MFRHPAFQANLCCIIIICTIVALLLANQGVVSSSSVLAQHGVTSYQQRSRPARKQKGVLGPSTTENQPVIFVHGMNENAHHMGKSEFAPLYASLQPIVGSVQTFFYVDDQAYADGTDPTLSCPPNILPVLAKVRY